MHLSFTLLVVDEQQDHTIPEEERTIYETNLRYLPWRKQHLLNMLQQSPFANNNRPVSFYRVLRVKVVIFYAGRLGGVRSYRPYDFCAWLYHDGRLTRPQPKLKGRLFDPI